MKKAVSVLLLSGLSLFAQPGVLGRGSHASDSARIYWETRVDPATPKPVFNSFGTDSAKDGWVSKAMIDRSSRTYFGYDVKGEPASDNGIRVTFRPLTITPEMERHYQIDNPSSWKTWSVSVPPPQVLRPGEVIAIDLMTNPATGQKIVDYVSVVENEPTTFANTTRGAREFFFFPFEARDFRIEDAALRLREPRLTVTKSGGTTSYQSQSDVTGPVTWFYIPNRGRFLLSLIPRTGFEKLGEVRGTTARITIDGETFLLNGAAPIALGDAAFNLYVRREPAFRSEPATMFLVGAGQ